MNIQFNLLPVVKLEYAKSQRNKRLTILIAGGITALSLIIVITLFLVIQVFQKNYSADLSEQIKDQTRQLQGVTDINKILTIQNQLASLDTLHSQKPKVTRLLPFIQQLIPKDANISTMNVDFSAANITISGSAKTITDVNKFADTLKFTDFSITLGENEPKKSCAKEQSYDQDKKLQICQGFSAVVLNSFSPLPGTTNYSLSFKYDPVMFDGNSNVKLVVPTNKITTRSETEKPGLFQGQEGGQ